MLDAIGKHGRVLSRNPWCSVGSILTMDQLSIRLVIPMNYFEQVWLSGQQYLNGFKQGV